MFYMLQCVRFTRSGKKAYCIQINIYLFVKFSHQQLLYSALLYSDLLYSTLPCPALLYFYSSLLDVSPGFLMLPVLLLFSFCWVIASLTMRDSYIFSNTSCDIRVES